MHGVVHGDEDDAGVLIRISEPGEEEDGHVVVPVEKKEGGREEKKKLVSSNHVLCVCVSFSSPFICLYFPNPVSYIARRKGRREGGTKGGRKGGHVPMQENRVLLPEHHEDRVQQLGHLTQHKRLDPKPDGTIAIQRLGRPTQHLKEEVGRERGRGGQKDEYIYEFCRSFVFLTQPRN